MDITEQILAYCYGLTSLRRMNPCHANPISQMDFRFAWQKNI